MCRKQKWPVRGIEEDIVIASSSNQHHEPSISGGSPTPSTTEGTRKDATRRAVDVGAHALYDSDSLSEDDDSRLNAATSTKMNSASQVSMAKNESEIGSNGTSRIGSESNFEESPNMKASSARGSVDDITQCYPQEDGQLHQVVPYVKLKQDLSRKQTRTSMPIHVDSDSDEVVDEEVEVRSLTIRSLTADISNSISTRKLLSDQVSLQHVLPAGIPATEINFRNHLSTRKCVSEATVELELDDKDPTNAPTGDKQLQDSEAFRHDCFTSSGSREQRISGQQAVQLNGSPRIDLRSADKPTNGRQTAKSQQRITDVRTMSSDALWGPKTTVESKSSISSSPYSVGQAVKKRSPTRKARRKALEEINVFYDPSEPEIPLIARVVTELLVAECDHEKENYRPDDGISLEQYPDDSQETTQDRSNTPSTPLLPRLMSRSTMSHIGELAGANFDSPYATPGGMREYRQRSVIYNSLHVTEALIGRH